MKFQPTHFKTFAGNPHGFLAERVARGWSSSFSLREAPQCPSSASDKLKFGLQRRRAGFTLAEVLAALVFMAIVIPVAVQGLRVANLSGQVAERKGIATRLADRMLNVLVVTGQWKQAGQSGTVQEDHGQYHWQLRNDVWAKDTMRQVSIQVTFAAQGQDYDVVLTTLVDNTTQ